jgi:hypothetical protein
MTVMQHGNKVQLSAPTYLQLSEAPFEEAVLSVREHVPSEPVRERPEQPLVVLTFHPGYLTGSYQDWDYFAGLAPLVFEKVQAAGRLRLFTMNHPGYDLPSGAAIDHFRLEPYRVCHQPNAIQAAVSWLFKEHLAEEEQMVWVAYGHSMGGLALSQYQAGELINELAKDGRSLHLTKILSAPALFLQEQAKANMKRLDVLHRLKVTAGRLPFYTRVATGLYNAFAPLFYQREAARYSIESLGDFRNFRHLNPFLLLEQGRELLSLEAAAVGGPALLADTHVMLAQQDGMVDWQATQAFIKEAQQRGYTVHRYELNSTHLLELDVPEAVAEIVCHVIHQALAATSESASAATAKTRAK